jgi:hypothetical protein
MKGVFLITFCLLQCTLFCITIVSFIVSPFYSISPFPRGFILFHKYVLFTTCEVMCFTPNFMQQEWNRDYNCEYWCQFSRRNEAFIAFSIMVSSLWPLTLHFTVLYYSETYKKILLKMRAQARVEEDLKMEESSRVATFLKEKEKKKKRLVEQLYQELVYQELLRKK